VVLVDTSAWIEFLRKTSSATHLGLKDRIQRGEAVAVTDPVVLELLAGASNAKELHVLQGFIYGCELIPVFGLTDYENASSIYRQCRANGKTLRNLLDCLIAAVAIREDVPLLHNDQDFDFIAEHTPLKIAQAV
jgi:predicted nucleic acid-binding protein